MPFEYPGWLSRATPGFFMPGCACCAEGDYVHVYYGGSTLHNDRYDEVSNSWSALADATGPNRTSPGFGATIATEIYAFGGVSTASLLDTEEYTPDSWTGKTDMPAPARAVMPAPVVSGAAYLFGGTQDLPATTYLLDCDEYAPDTWTSKTDLPSPDRTGCAGASIGSAAYCAFGVRSPFVPGTALTDNDEYTPSGDSWSARTNGPSPARINSRACTIAGLMYCFAGNNTISATFADNDEYDAGGDSWTSRTDLPAAVTQGGAASTSGGYGYYVGGGSTIIRRYDQGGDSWSSMTNMPTPNRSNHATATLT